MKRRYLIVVCLAALTAAMVLAAVSPAFGDKIDFQFKAGPDQEKLDAALRAAVEGAGVKVSEVRREQGLSAGSVSFSYQV